jgi:hypothetical protein
MVPPQPCGFLSSQMPIRGPDLRPLLCTGVEHRPSVVALQVVRHEAVES